MEEKQHDGTKCLVFKCDKTGDDLNGTCASKLVVYENGNGYLISGVLTHTNHVTKENVIESMPVAQQKYKAMPKKPVKPSVPQKSNAVNLFSTIRPKNECAKLTSKSHNSKNYFIFSVKRTKKHVDIKNKRFDLVDLGFRQNSSQIGCK